MDKKNIILIALGVLLLVIGFLAYLAVRITLRPLLAAPRTCQP